MSKWHRWRWLIQLIGVGLFIWLLTRVDVEGILRQVANARWPLVLASVSLGVPFIWFKSERWRLVLEWTGTNLPSTTAFSLFAIGLLAGLVTPGQLGEFGKAVDVRRQGGTIRSGLLASLSDRGFDLVIFVGMVVYSVFISRGNLLQLAQVNGVLLALLVFVLNALTAAAVMGLLSRFGRPKGSTMKATNQSIYSKVFLGSIVCTLFSFFIYNLRLYLLLTSLGEWIPWGAFMISMAIMSLVTLLPVTIAGVGTRDLVLISLFQIFGIGAETVVAFSALVLLLYIFNGLIGLFAWVTYWRSFQAAGKGK